MKGVGNVRVALVAPEDLPIPPVRGGSVQIYMDALCRELGSVLNSEVFLISPGHRHADIGNVSHITVNGPRRKYRLGVLRQLKRLSPDVIQIDNRPDFVPLVKRAVPQSKIVLNLHSTTFLGPMNIRPQLAKNVLQMADVVVLNSAWLQRRIASKFQLAPGQWNARVIHPGVHIHKFMPRPSLSPVNSRPFRILYVGRVIEQKGVHIAVNAIRQLHRSRIPVTLRIIGRTPPWERRYENKIRTLIRGLPVNWEGYVSPSRLPGHLWKSHVLVCPSQRNEAFGMVNVEAIAAGIPVIASKQGGIPEILDASCAILISDYKKPDRFAKAIQQLMDDPSYYENLKKGTRKRAAQFTWKRAARQFVQIYYG